MPGKNSLLSILPILTIPNLGTGGYSVPQSVISGATTVRRARSVAEMSAHGGSPFFSFFLIFFMWLPLFFYFFFYFFLGGSPGAPGHHGSLGGHGQAGGQVQRNLVHLQTIVHDFLLLQVEPKSLHASMASLAQSHHQHHGGSTMPHHHRMVLGENG